MPATAEVVKRHPRLLEILASVLEGKPLRQVAEAFNCPLAELQAYAREAGLLPGRDPEPQPPPSEPPCSEAVEAAEGTEPEDVVDRSAEHERQALTEATRRRGEPEGLRPEHEDGDFLEEQRRIQQQALELVEAARRSYESQPMPSIGARLAGDPLIPGFELHIGFQPPERLAMLMLREGQQRNERLREWRSDPFNWRREPPSELFQ